MNYTRFLYRTEFYYALLLLSGSIKSYIILLSYDAFDFTLIIGLILIVVLIKQLVTNMGVLKFSKLQLISLFLILSFLCSIIFSTIYTPSQSYYIAKFTSFGVCLLAYCYLLFIRNFDCQEFLKYFVNLSAILALIFLTIYPLVPDYLILADLTSMYLTVGYLCGINVLLLIKMPERSVYIKLYFVVALVLTGARGPILAAAFSYLIVLLFSKQEIRKYLKLRYWVISGFTLLLVFFYITQDENLSSMFVRSFNRLTLVFDGFSGRSIDIRLDQLYSSLAYIDDQPFFGYGFASYNFVTQGVDMRGYPHNSILEIWFELGLAGLAIYIIFTVFHLYLTFSRIGVAAGAVLLFMLINSLKSSSFTDLKIMYGFYSLFLLLVHNKYFGISRSRQTSSLSSHDR